MDGARERKSEKKIPRTPNSARERENSRAVLAKEREREGEKEEGRKRGKEGRRRKK